MMHPPIACLVSWLVRAPDAGIDAGIDADIDASHAGL